MKILIVDLLFIENGSLGDDSRAIVGFLSENDCTYLRLENGHEAKNLLRLYLKSTLQKYDHIIILSAKIIQLLFLIPLSLYNRMSFIYHFTPAHRVRFHKCSLKILKHFFKIGTYSQGVKEFLEVLLKKEVQLLPSREIDLEKSIELLRDKLSNKHISILVPGIRPGVRNFPDLKEALNKIYSCLDIIIDEISIQGNKGPLSENYVDATFLSALSNEDYGRLYKKSLFVIVDFHESYEVRASGILLDAMQFGCIVISNDHQISKQYGFPDSFIKSIESIKNIRDLNIANISNIYPYWSLNMAKKSWNKFLL
jgi:hypothetical protein